jgi:hypothetical protein
LFAYCLAPIEHREQLVDWAPGKGPWELSSIDSWECEGAAIAKMTVRMGPDLYDEDLMTLLGTLWSSVAGLGATVMWAGDETCTPNPDVLRPGNRSGNVLAAGSVGCGLLRSTRSSNDGFLDDDDLARIWPVVATLLDP